MIGADFDECNTTVKSEAIFGCVFDAHTPLNIGNNWCLISLAEISECNTSAFFLAAHTQ